MSIFPTIRSRTGSALLRVRLGKGDTALWLALAPAALLLLAFVIAPLFLVLRDSFTVASLDGGTTGQLTTTNYTQIFQSEYISVFGHSLVVAAENTVICLIVGYCVAFAIVTRPPAKQPALLLLLLVPFWTDFIIRTFTWINLLSDQGVVASLLRSAGLVHGSFNAIPSGGAVFLGLLYAFLPSAVLPIYAALRASDLTLLEAAEDLGCGRLALHRRVVLPMASTGLLGASLLIFVPTMGVYVTTVLLGGGKQLLIGNLLEIVYLEFRNIPFGAALSIVMTAFMLVALGIGAVISSRYRRRLA